MLQMRHMRVSKTKIFQTSKHLILDLRMGCFFIEAYMITIMRTSQSRKVCRDTSISVRLYMGNEFALIYLCNPHALALDMNICKVVPIFLVIYSPNGFSQTATCLARIQLKRTIETHEPVFGHKACVTGNKTWE